VGKRGKAKRERRRVDNVAAGKEKNKIEKGKEVEEGKKKSWKKGVGYRGGEWKES